MTDSSRFGPYEILGELGSGGFATVFRARDTRLGREVALKVLDPLLTRESGFVNRFEQEARAIAALRHPRIVTVFETGQIGGRYFIAMEYVPGPSLYDHLKESGALPWLKARQIALEVAEALAYAHQKGVVHRDVKPGNILLDPDRGAMLVDFGFARLMGSSAMSLSLSGGVIGTPAYIPVEVWEGSKAGPSADVYALGCILYEAVTGQVLFNSVTPIAVMRQHDKGPEWPTKWPAGTPPEFAVMLKVMLARQPEERYEDGAAALQAIQALKVAGLTRPAAGGRAQAKRAVPYALLVAKGSRLLDVRFGRRITLPAIEWGREVPAGNYTIGDEEPLNDYEALRPALIAQPYRLAKYPVTNAQFNCFINAPDVDNDRWWEGMPEDEKYRKRIAKPRWSQADRPRETVTWYQAIAYCRWLDYHFRAEGAVSPDERIDLPHEYEWEVAARYAGDGRVDRRVYPFGNTITPKHANYYETYLNGTSEVGCTPAGVQRELQLYDLCGNVWEWCRNKFDKLEDVAVDHSGERRTMRGGSWDDFRDTLRAAFRTWYFPSLSDTALGFRVAVRRPPSQHGE